MGLSTGHGAWDRTNYIALLVPGWNLAWVLSYASEPAHQGGTAIIYSSGSNLVIHLERNVELYDLCSCHMQALFLVATIARSGPV